MEAQVNVLFIQASGLGNSILLSPTIKRLHESHLNTSIDLYVYREEFAAPYRGADCVHRIFVHEGLSTLLSLRREAYDVSFCGFPSNRWQYHLLSRFIGSSHRIAHDYPVGYGRTLRFLETDLVPAQSHLHDVEQNLQLLKPLNLPEEPPPDLLFSIDSQQVKRAKAFLDQRDLLDDHLIGIHPGSGPLTWKRAPLTVFLRLLKKHAQPSSHVLVFGGPEEGELKETCRNRIQAETNLQSTRIDTNLSRTAALLAECDLFISNDTGLSHVAAAVRTPSQITIFNGTNPIRTRPWRDDATIIQLRQNEMNYPYTSTRPIRK